MPVITINEVAWMGTGSSYNNEWIELYNNTDSSINLDGWILKAADGVPTIKLTGVISANDFYLLERSKDYTGALNNKGEKLELYDNSGNLIDSADCLAGWLAGDNSTKQTMERKDFQSWQTSQGPGGTPKLKNSALAEETIRPVSLPPSVEQPKTTDDQKKPEEDNFSKDLAAMGEQIPQTRGVSVIILLTALALAILSGVTILILKKRLK